MSVESKLDAILVGQSAILTAIKDAPGIDASAITAALTKIDGEVAAIDTTLGTEAPTA